MAADGSPFAPLRHRLFAWLWVTNAVSALGAFIQSTATAWVMTDLAPDPLMVSLVQAASQLPFLLLALPAGALADIVDRQRYLIATNTSMLAVAGALAVLYALGMVTAWALLGLTALLAALTALNSPALASSVPATVPRHDLQQALVLNSIGYNIARALGPGICGVIVASLGAAAAFATNAACFAIVAVVTATTLALPRSAGVSGIPPERLTRATRQGVRYAMAEPAVRATLIRSAAFYAFAGAIWALLPLYVREVLDLSSAGYGLMLGAIGAGAVLGGILMPRLRDRVSRDGFVLLAGLMTGGALIPLALMPSPGAAVVAMLIYGMGWIVGASNLQATVQLASAPWVRARGLAIYQAVLNGGLGLGAVAWGWLGQHLGLTGTLLVAGLGGIAMTWVSKWVTLPEEVLDPSLTAERPPPRVQVHKSVSPELETRRTPVLVTIAYHVDPAETPAFRAAMAELSAARRRDGAVAWMLARDVERPEAWVEAFRLPDWHELRRGVARLNLTDSMAVEKAKSFHRGAGPPEVRVLLAEAW
ncbi:MFS transporter [Sabulicella rubraurantiaca]|uniref:MFS transporter n=1 Tax=Sabulicella rubraurantiaca TaxID=2811429 RepID=UPI001A96C5AD|nr:MFS transporter [Sabulicella rubraurantiaca]